MSLAGRSTLVDRLKLFARFEAHCLARRYAHFSACTRVATDAGLAGTNVEDAEAAQFNAIALRQSLLHTLEDGLDGHFRFGLGDSRLVHDFVDDVEFDHNRLRRTFSVAGN